MTTLMSDEALLEALASCLTTAAFGGSPLNTDEENDNVRTEAWNEAVALIKQQKALDEAKVPTKNRHGIDEHGRIF